VTEQAATSARTPETHTAGRWALASLALSMLLSSLGTSIANVGLPTLAHAFGASFHAVQWVILAYLLASTTLLVSVGRLGDLVGRRRLLMAGLLVFTGASALCGVAHSLAMLIVARAVQGLGAAVMMALAMALVGETVPKAQTGRAMGVLGTMSAIGTALGPSLGGLLIDGLGWRAIFLVNVPCALLTLGLAYRALPADRQAPTSERARFDAIGTALLAGTLGAYALAVTVGGRGGFGGWNLVLLAAAGCGSGWFVLVESRAPSPLVRWSALRAAGVRASLGMSALVSTVMMATLVVGPFYLSRGLGLGRTSVGLVLSVGPLVAALTGVPAGRVTDRLGARRVTIAGLIAMAVGCATLSALSATLGVAGYAAAIAATTMGYAIFQTANNTAVMADVVAAQRGVMSGLLQLSRNLGLITGASVMGAVFAAAAATSDLASAEPDAVIAGMRVTFGVAVLLIASALVIAARRGTLRRAGRLVVLRSSSSR